MDRAVFVREWLARAAAAYAELDRDPPVVHDPYDPHDDPGLPSNR